jgi:sorbose reductase
VTSAINAQVAEFNNRLDIFVANAGIPWTQGRMIDGELSHYHKVVATDLDSVFYCARAAGEIWRRQYVDAQTSSSHLPNYSGGSFIATGSMSGHVANVPQLQSAYNAAKAGVIHLTRSLAVEWVRFARANSVSPGYMATEISDFVPPETKAIWRTKIPMGREGEAPELKGVYLYLASDASSYTTGADHVVDGGYTAV